MVQQTADGLLSTVEEYIIQFFEDNISSRFVFHDLDHTQSVVESVIEIGEGYELTEEDLQLLQLAAWFHDLGYDQGAKQHEDRSMQYARAFLEEHQYPEEAIRKIEGCIQATRVPQSPKNLLEEILCDADLSHLGKSSYWTRTGKIRQELIMTKNIIRSEQEWVEFELNFMLQHRYHTPVASRLYNEGKSKHIRQLYKQKARLNPESGDLPSIPKKTKKKKKKKDKFINTELSQLRLGRGVETMYRVTYRTHINLSSIADNKANIMLSINAIIISIVVSTLVPSFAENKMLIIPTMILLGVCLIAVIFATLSTRPKVTEGKFTRTDIEEKNTNLLFFGNYYNMDLDDFHWGMMEMIKDTDFLYSSMTRDLYYLGKVLAKKYAYLRICYAVFMWGLIGAVLAFAITFMVS
jgi:predicted metal-dependent HD superfamily phosphohydrolase